MTDLPEREMVKCEACGEYHYKDECEIVVIRMIKGKDCKLKPMGAQSTPMFKEVVPDIRTTMKDVEIVAEVKEEPKPEMPLKRKNIIPPGMGSMMLPPDHPNFESHGAKEKRYA